MTKLSRQVPGLTALSIFVAIGMQPLASCAASLRDQIVGRWEPVSQYVDQNGKRLEPFGAQPKGSVVYDASGHFVSVLQRGTLPRFASNNRATGSAEENKAIVQGSIAYFGTYTIDEHQRKLSMHFDGSTYPNWDGTDQVRPIELSGDELHIVVPAASIGGGVGHLFLRRAKDGFGK
ncbi:lipocalin-like domain-containing protein [Roseateles saccharophilus]|uniref:Lipocalin-like protein n=1 Tax=Roseateles saccharophilus TaxID=304 RepID=A0A4R3UPC8_ROSSA|nr:lipocalin-like domain-containing protein [Roseateles saccharophilus]TCU92138.1 lipocalin-like protein [Roseateles saccharophilus]